MTDGGHIRLLSPEVANKIAAGEVVERPASILKELVENAIDAGATQIDVEVVSGGTRLIAVADNGSGMNRDDALLSVERHATSKIHTAQDIENIHTLGFRGEALAAIASVSRFRICTRRASDLAGTELTMSGGKLLDVRDAGCPAGTLMEVRDLFFNMPARRKFLRSPQTEVTHLRQMFLVHALAWPGIGMKLTVDGRATWMLPGNGSLDERIRELFGAEVKGALCEVGLEAGPVRVSGFVSRPTLHRGDRSEQYVFVNRRPATAPVVGYGIGEAYHALLADGRHPYVFLFIDLPVDQVDVNVHPTKREVRFRQPSEVRDALIRAIRVALQGGGGGFILGRDESRDAVPVAPPPGPDEALLRIDDLPAARAFAYPKLPPPEAFVPRPSAGGASAAAGAGGGGNEDSGTGRTTAGTGTGGQSPWAWCRVVGQVGGLYVLLETEDGLVIMDPHAAHERVLFEKIMRAVETGSVESQGLLTAETAELPPRDALFVRKHIEVMRKLGIGVSEFGGDAFVVDALPPEFKAVAIKDMLIDVARHLELLGERGSGTRWREEAIAQAACKAAVKARDRLNLAEIERLVVALASAEMPYTCPHGRPTLIHMSFKELARKFGRE
jgi:DNA mismatch repair protein MutL